MTNNEAKLASGMLVNDWINVNEDLPYKHKELLLTESRTINVFIKDEYEDLSIDFMIKVNNKWHWNGNYPSDYSYWMIPSGVTNG